MYSYFLLAVCEFFANRLSVRFAGNVRHEQLSTPSSLITPDTRQNLHTAVRRRPKQKTTQRARAQEKKNCCCVGTHIGAIETQQSPSSAQILRQSLRLWDRALLFPLPTSSTQTEYSASLEARRNHKHGYSGNRASPPAAAVSSPGCNTKQASTGRHVGGS